MPGDLQIDNDNSTASQKQSQNAATDNGKVLTGYEMFKQMQLSQEREFLIAKIRECNGSVRLAAEKLGLLRTALYNRLNHLGVNIKEL